MQTTEKIKLLENAGVNLDFFGEFRPLRERIFGFFEQKLATMTKANGFNFDLGAEVFRGFLPPVDFEILPATGYIPRGEDSINLYGNHQTLALTVEVQGIAKIESIPPPQLVELIYADILEAVLGNTWTLNFDSGGTYKATVGKYIVGQTSRAIGYIGGVSLSSGAWTAGTAAGVFTLRRVVGEFLDDEPIDLGSNDDIATVDGAATALSALITTTGGLADGITVASAQPQFPNQDELSAGVNVEFLINYKRVAGNPYNQTN